jgi:hypothetical protein
MNNGTFNKKFLLTRDKFNNNNIKEKIEDIQIKDRSPLMFNRNVPQKMKFVKSNKLDDKTKYLSEANVNLNNNINLINDSLSSVRNKNYSAKFKEVKDESNFNNKVINSLELNNIKYLEMEKNIMMLEKEIKHLKLVNENINFRKFQNKIK